MSYIRTKNGVYKIDEIKPYFLDEKQKLFINNELKVAINEKQVINQSENLEELCDEFVDIIPRENGKAYHDLWEWSVEEKRFNNDIGESVPFDYFSDNTYFRGAIWTSKGLIYVAKMNENGVLELI